MLTFHMKLSLATCLVLSVTGVLACLVSVTGCLGAWGEAPRLLKFSSGVLVVLGSLHLLGVTLACVACVTVDDNLPQAMGKTMAHYKSYTEDSSRS